MGDAFAFHRFAEALRAELRDRYLAGTESRCCEHEWKVQDVKDRRGVKMHAAFSIGHPVVEMVDIRQDVGVSHDYAFGVARRAAGVDQGQDRFWVVNRLGMAIV